MSKGPEVDDDNETWRATGLGLLILIVGATVLFLIKSHEKIVF